MKTVAEWRKILKLSYGQKGITIKGIKTEETSLEIPEMIGNQKVVEIGAYAFEGCKSLVSITIPESVEKIDCGAFLGCLNLSTVNIPENNIAISTDVFRGCKKLADDKGFVIVKGILYDYCGCETHVEIPNTVTVLSYAFCWNKIMTSVVLPNTIKRIPSYEFSSCENLEHIHMPEGVITIGGNVFSDCKNLKQISLPEGMVEIGPQAFDRCENLENIYIPKSVTEIWDEAFYRCHKLTIHAPTGSYAEQYAKKYNIPFVEEQRSKA